MTTSEDESVMEFESTPPELRETSSSAKVDLVPQKSKEVYWKGYNGFIEWKDAKKVKVITENVMLAYFKILSKDYSPSSLWKYRSMLKSTLLIKHGIKLDDFHELTALLKQFSKNYKVKKSKVLTPEEMKMFLTNAPNNKYLAIKVALVFGLYGDCRHSELLNLTIADVVDLGQIIKVSLNDTKTKALRTFVIDGEYLELIRSYVALRPKSLPNSSRYFLRYDDNKCSKQVIGKNKIGAMPAVTAKFLNLEDSNLYTDHAFRRSSATLAADSGMSMIDLKRLGGWASTSVAEGYIEESIHHKKQASRQISNVIAGIPQEEDNNTVQEPESKRAKLDEASSVSISGNIQNTSNLLSIADRVSLNVSNSSNFQMHIHIK